MDEQERTVQVALATAGDQDALQQLIVEYHDQLTGFLGTRMDPSLRRLVGLDDILQEAYAAAFQAIADCQFDGPAAFYGWLETIALNRAERFTNHLL